MTDITQADLDFVDSIIFDDLNWTFERAYAAAARHREQSIAPYREALDYAGKLLPIGDGSAPDDRVIPIYVRMSELRYLRSAIATLQQGAK